MGLQFAQYTHKHAYRWSYIENAINLVYSLHSTYTHIKTNTGPIIENNINGFTVYTVHTNKHAYQWKY